VSPQNAWDLAKANALELAESFYKAGYHKQVYNRLLEPFQMIKVVVTATEWNNFFWLRNHPAADPTIAALAQVMKTAFEGAIVNIVPLKTQYEERYLHLPYVEEDELKSLAEKEVSRFDLIQTSVARCAAVSYRNENYTLDKCKEIYTRLVGDDPKHASALEHVATPMFSYTSVTDDGVTHMDRDQEMWSGNFKHWIQYRQLIDGHVMPG
jgi:hypothetical protein